MLLIIQIGRRGYGERLVLCASLMAVVSFYFLLSNSIQSHVPVYQSSPTFQSISPVPRSSRSIQSHVPVDQSSPTLQSLVPVENPVQRLETPYYVWVYGASLSHSFTESSLAADSFFVDSQVFKTVGLEVAGAK